MKQKVSGKSDENRYTVESVADGSVQGCPRLTPDDVVRVIGQRLFQKARHTIIDQQNIFSGQIFELHRLIKVQRSMGRSQNASEKNFNPNKVQIRFDRPKIDALKPNAEEVHFPPKLPPTRNIIPSTNAKVEAPYMFLSPFGNQCLVPFQCPFEGLVYKSYLGPCFPTSSFTSGSEIGQGYLCNYTMPTLNCAGAENVRSKEEPVQKDGLPHFPMTPSDEEPKDENDGKKLRVVKVVPHNRKLAPESAARIFESLQEERRVLRLSSCT